jgi:hypothetical protein
VGVRRLNFRTSKQEIEKALAALGVLVSREKKQKNNDPLRRYDLLNNYEIIVTFDLLIIIWIS